MTNRNPFAPAVREDVRIRMLLIGKTGSGKTYTALALACHVAKATGTRVAVVDTEDKTARLYAGEACACAQCRGHGLRFAFDDLLLSSCSPKHYMDAMAAASANGYGVIVLDSISHEWDGPGGCLAMVDASPNKNKHAAWGPVTQAHNDFLAAVRSWPGHVFATVRGKEKHEKQGRDVVSLGVLPVQREGIEYEFDLAMFLDGARGNVVKSRSSALAGWLGDRPGSELAGAMLAWAGSAAAPPPERRPDPTPRPPHGLPATSQPPRESRGSTTAATQATGATGPSPEPRPPAPTPADPLGEAKREAFRVVADLADRGKQESAEQAIREAETLERVASIHQYAKVLLAKQGATPEPPPAHEPTAGRSAWADRGAALDDGPELPEGL